MPSEVGQEPAGSMIALISVVVIACEQALLFGQAKRASRERAREGPIEDKAHSHVLGRLVSLAQTVLVVSASGVLGQVPRLCGREAPPRFQPLILLCTLFDKKGTLFVYFFLANDGPLPHTWFRRLHQKTHKKHTHKNKNRNTASYLH